jgi:hypothetical protein
VSFCSRVSRTDLLFLHRHSAWLTSVCLTERNGPKLYVPVENPTATSVLSAPPANNGVADDIMQLDNSKYKVYIYNLDDELSSSESEPEEGRLAFLPDIQKHLYANRIPPAVLANDEGELAGMQLVLYQVPSSLTVPQEQDSVRKAIIETRARMREKQRQDLEVKGKTPAVNLTNVGTSQDTTSLGSIAQHDPDAMDLD